MKYYKTVFFWHTDFKTYDISLGIHICWSGRIDLHILNRMISFGNIPLYKTQKGDIIAVSNSWHNTKKGNIRVGTP